MFQIAWLNARPYCWCASIDGGKTWTKLKADNDEDSSEPVEEAAIKFGMAPNKWNLLDELIIKLS